MILFRLHLLFLLLILYCFKSSNLDCDPLRSDCSNFDLSSKEDPTTISLEDFAQKLNQKYEQRKQKKERQNHKQRLVCFVVFACGNVCMDWNLNASIFCETPSPEKKIANLRKANK